MITKPRITTTDENIQNPLKNQLQLLSLKNVYTTLIQLITLNKLGLYHIFLPGTT